MTALKTNTRHDCEEFNTWLLSIDKVSKLTGQDPKEIYFAKAEDNLIKFQYSLPLHKGSWYS